MTPKEFEDVWALVCLKAKREAEKHGLPLTKITLMGRDPNDDKMYVCVSNEDPEGLRHMLELPLSLQGNPGRPYATYRCPHDGDVAEHLWGCGVCNEAHESFAAAEYCGDHCRVANSIAGGGE